MAREAAAPAQKCGPAPNAMLLAVSRVRSNLSALAKCASSRLAEPNIRNTRSSGAKSTPFTLAALAMRRGDMPIGEIQRANSSNTCSHDTLPSRTRANWSGCVSSAQMQPAIALRGSFCPPEIVSLMLWRTFSSGMPPWIITLSSEWFGVLRTTGSMS